MRRMVRELSLALVLAGTAMAATPADAREVVSWRGDFSPGTIVVRTSERRLYYVKGDGTAVVKRDKPSLPDVIPGGSPRNPMGAAALTLSGGEYAIHGTNQPGSIGGFVSYGCIRMHNSDVLDLYQRVSLGTTVVVTR
jgi:lipoprotein-anchoring transpeptidase ErfK/SrfK